MHFVHDGTTRKWWVLGVLEILNVGPASNVQLPADGLVRVMQELLDAGEFERLKLDRSSALAALNTAIARDGLQAYFDAAGRCYVRNIGTQATSAGLQLQKRTWTAEELARRAKLSAYLDEASEDDFIQHVLLRHPSQARQA